MTRFRTEVCDHWPPLSWLAKCTPGSDEIEVRHGVGVEIHDEWLGEAVWAGRYRTGDLDRTDIVFGSGARIRDHRVTFVSAASTVDRLQSFRDGAHVWVSNSLPCLLAAVGARLPTAYPHYFRDFRTIADGLHRYRQRLDTTKGPVSLTYYHNLMWDGIDLREVRKPAMLRNLNSFEQYRAFLDSALERLVANMADPDRPRRYQLLGTMSSGYDSPTVAALARPHGLRDVLSFQRYDLDPDSGAPLARQLGLNVVRIPTHAWREQPRPETAFLAADAKGEDVYFAGAEPHLGQRVLLTGFHGDKMWGRATRAVSPDIVRGDQSGLSLTEYRLRAGFIHCPIPFLGVRQIRDIRAISRSHELAPWNVSGHYNRPICRRIVEEAGGTRLSFGIEKRVASVLFFDRETFLTEGARDEYRQWLDDTLPERQARAVRGRGVSELIDPIVAVVARGLRAAADWTPPAMRRFPRLIADRVGAWTRREPMFRYLLPWAMEHATHAYQTDARPARDGRRSLPHTQQGASRAG